MDKFRKNYTPITDEQKALVAAIKEKAEELDALYQQVYNTIKHQDVVRCITAASVDLEASVMWGVKAATAEIPQVAA